MRQFKLIKRFGTIAYLGSLVLAFIWFGWKMALVLFLLSWALGANQELGKYS